MISAILLAAGKSKRMGKLKQLLPFGQSTIVEQAIDNLLGSTIDEVIAVVGHKAEEVIEKIASRPIKLVKNPDYEQGMSTSIIAGLSLVDDGAHAIMFVLGDQPLIDSQTMTRLAKEFRSHDKGIAVPTYRGARGHPVILAVKYKEELLELNGDIGGRQIVENHPGDVLEVPVSCEGVCVDINTVDDYYMRGKR